MRAAPVAHALNLHLGVANVRELAVGAPAKFSTVMDGARTPLGKALKKEALKTLRRAKYEMKRLRSARCGQCRGCNSGDCGTCKNCRDKPRFGGPGVKKKACVARACVRAQQQADEESDDQSEEDAASAHGSEPSTVHEISPAILATDGGGVVTSPQHQRPADDDAARRRNEMTDVLSKSCPGWHRMLTAPWFRVPTARS